MTSSRARVCAPCRSGMLELPVAARHRRARVALAGIGIAQLPGHREREGRTLPQLACGDERAAQEPGELAGKRQAEPGAGGPPLEDAVHLGILLEDALEVGRR